MVLNWCRSCNGVLHNLYFYNDLMAKIREAIDEGRYEEFYRHYRDILAIRI